MRLTKFEHACFTVEKDGKLLVVDPGVWTTDLGSPENVVGIVVTHEHPDHFDPAALGALIAHNPDCIIYAHETITRQLEDALPNQAVATGGSIVVGPFNLEFFGGEHAVIHQSLPIVPNLGVMINGTLYYPGDSFVVPNKKVKVLALPVAAPWLKISESIDFALTIKAELVFPTHDAVASDAGKQMPDKRLPSFIEQYDGQYRRLSETIEI